MVHWPFFKFADSTFRCKTMLLLLLLSVLFGYSSGYYVMPEVVSIVEPPVDTEVCEGCRLELACAILYQNTAANLPQPEIMWLVNGTDAPSEVQTESTTSDDFTNSTLIVPSTLLEHEGSYRCVVVDGNATSHCHSPRHPCVPLVTISREARVKVLDNTTNSTSEGSIASSEYNSSIPCNITSRHKETMFIGPESVNGTTCIELSCPVDEECVSVSNITWYHNGEEIPARGAVCGNISQLYGVYQCFVSPTNNGRHTLEASITRVLPHGLTNPPGRPNASEIPRANANVLLTGVEISWTRPAFIGGLSYNDLQYEIMHISKVYRSNDTRIEIFSSALWRRLLIVSVINSRRQISESSERTINLIPQCTLEVRFPPDLTLTCTDGGFNLSWIDSPRNEAYKVYSDNIDYYSRNTCVTNGQTLQQPLESGNYQNPLVRTDLYEVGTHCRFSVATAVNPAIQCNYSIDYPSGHKCNCYDPSLIEYSPWEYCEVQGSLHFEKDTVRYSIQENGSTIEVCVVAEGYGFTANVITADVAAKGGEDYSTVNETLSFNETVRRHCIMISIFNDAILEDSESFEVLLRDVSSSLVTITTGSATIEITDDDSVMANVTVSKRNITEGDAPVEICVHLPRVETNVTLDLTTNDISAEAEEDFIIDEDELVFTPTSSQTQCVHITVIDDDLLETGESFSVTLNTSNTSRVIISEDHFEIVIEDSDEVSVVLTETSFSVSEERGSLSVCAMVNGSLGRSVTVGIVAVDNTTVGGEDYGLVESQLVFDASHYNDCVSVTIIDDAVLEDPERFTVMLRGGDSQRVRVSTQPATVEITDNDYVNVSLLVTPPLLVTEPQSGEVPLNVCVVVEGTFTRREPVVVFINTTDGSASEGDGDYTARTGGDASFSFHQDGPSILCNESIVSVKGDDVIECNEHFSISLSLPSSENNPEGVRYGALPQATVTIQDNPEYHVEIQFDQREYEVHPQSNLSISIHLLTALQLERDIDVNVEIIDDFGPKVGKDFIPPNGTDLWFIFNNTKRTAQFNIHILTPEFLNNSFIYLNIIEGDYFSATFARVQITVATDAPPEGVDIAVQGALIGVFSALFVFLVLVLVIAIIMMLIKCNAFTKREKYYLGKGGHDFEVLASDPVVPGEKMGFSDDGDKFTVLDYPQYQSSLSVFVDYRDPTLLDDRRGSEPREERETLFADATPQGTDGGAANNNHFHIVVRRKISGSSASGTDSSSSQPYLPNPMCHCPRCVAERSGGLGSQGEERLEGESEDQSQGEEELCSETDKELTDQLPHKTPAKYMNTLTIVEDEEPLPNDNTRVVHSPSEHSVSLVGGTPVRSVGDGTPVRSAVDGTPVWSVVDGTPVRSVGGEMRHISCGTEHQLVMAEESELALQCFEVDDALPHVMVDHSGRSCRAVSDDPF